MSEPVRPDLGGACITRVMPSLLSRSKRSWMPEPVQQATSVVLLVLDGVGWLSLREHAAETPHLTSMTGGPITTVLPSSTASALTSLTTGAAPSQHGLTGIVLRTDGALLHTLRWSTGGRGRSPDPAQVQPLAPFEGRPVPVVSRAEFAGSGFSEAHLRGGRLVGWHTPSMLIQSCVELIDAGEELVYAYYDGVDVVSHLAGTASATYARELSFADRLCGELLDALPPSAALVITADHGQVDLHDEHWIEMDALSSLVNAHAGDARCRFLYARDGAAAELLAGARDVTGDRAWVLERDRALDEGWFGPRTPIAEERIGDVVLLGRDAAFLDPGMRGERLMRSGHGSATEAEMLVPLLAARGRRSQRRDAQNT